MVLPWSHRLPDYAAANPAYGQNLVDLGHLLATPVVPLTVSDIGVNVDDDARVTVVAAPLAVDDRAAGTAVRSGGTTRFVRGAGDGDSLPSITTTDLRDAHPTFTDLQLVESDTDDYDVSLVSAVAAAWEGARPVLSFGYDPELTRIAGHEPAHCWDVAVVHEDDAAGSTALDVLVPSSLTF